MSNSPSGPRLARPADIQIRDVGIARFALPLLRSWNSARGSRDTRQGWLIRLRSNQGTVGFGECSPLPGAGTESFESAARRLEDLLPGLKRHSAESALDMLRGVETSPAVCCALETAILDLASTEAGKPLSRLLDPEAADSVRVNAALGGLDDGVGERASLALSRGYRTVKLKLGIRPLGQEIEALYSLRQQLGDGTLLRLDANGAWDEATARKAIEALADLPIDALEEPLGKAELPAWRRLQALAPWPLAMDESLYRWPLSSLLDDPPARRIVVKPMVVGGPLATLDTAEQARRCGVEVVVTTTLDSAVATWAAVHTAAALGAGGTHGLATSGWLANDVGAPPFIEEGRIQVHTRPGLGVIPVESIQFEDVADV